jgi:crotonobetainyl-CoA:carnitine CoA-transferase CaiB-like acyl-CoA transferase
MTRPLEGVRIADFTLHNAGPFSTHLLSQLGAECIKVESAKRPDVFRKPHPVYGRQGPATFDQLAANKLSVRINLKHEEGAALARALAVVAGVVAESFRPGVMDRLGLGYERLRRERADLVMVSISSCGQSGPEAGFAGYAPLFGAWGGLGTLSGYEDGPPMEMRHVMDHAVGLNAALAAVAALLRRRRTGEGAHVDVAGREVAASLVGESLLLAAAGGHPARHGNADPGMAPHGVYPALARDTWLTIAVREEAAWQGLLRVMKREDLGQDPRFATLAARLAHRPPLDAEVALWTRTQDAEEAALLLQAERVAAHASREIREIVADPHLKARGAIIEVPEPGGGRRAAIGAPMRFSAAQGIGVSRPTPALGEHEDYVFGELLGLSRSERSRLEAAGAIC